MCYVHLGGGTPTVPKLSDIKILINYLRVQFNLSDEADIAVQNDPREFNQELPKTMAGGGVNRASLGLRDLYARLSQCRRGGLALGEDDRLRGAAIEQPMCFLEVDLGAIAGKFDPDPRVFAGDLAALEEMATDGLVEIDGRRVRMTEAGRRFLRTACAAFDSDLETATGRHAQAV